MFNGPLSFEISEKEKLLLPAHPYKALLVKLLKALIKILTKRQTKF